MVKKFIRRLTQWTGVERFRTRARQFMAWPAYDMDLLASMPGARRLGGSFATAPPPVAPASCEMLFMRLHTEGRFDEMWAMLADDAQLAWGGLQNFVHEMPRLDEWLEIMDMEVANVTMLDTWTDHLHQRTYSNVARLVMRYRVRQQLKEWTFDRMVHLVPQADGWRTLCYPTRPRTAAGH
jgi:hypothetical protein